MPVQVEEEGISFESIVSEVKRWASIVGNAASEILETQPDKQEVKNKKK